MKSILYVIVATALISVTPFLISFDPECVPYRGLMIYSIFAIFLIFTNLKERFSKKAKITLFATTFICITAISIIDTWSIITLLKLNPIIYCAIPFATTAISLLILKDVKPIAFKNINLALFCILFLHLALSNTSLEQPILTFTLVGLLH